MDLYQEEFATEIGVVYVVSDGIHLRAVDFADYEERMHRLLARHYGSYKLHAAHQPSEAVSRLKAYFAGDLQAVEDLAVATNGTPFQQQVWTALRAIPAGTSMTYAALAARIGRATACRAVGLANGANPIAIVVPCHRVAGADNSLTGYGGGLERKRWLLAHEGVELSKPKQNKPMALLA